MMSQELVGQNNKNAMNFIEAHFFSVPSQGNVYTLTPLTDAKGFTKLLVASLQRKVYCLEYTNGRPCMKDVPFTYIPGGAEIISIDAVNRSVIQEDFIIGITIIKKDDVTGQQSHFFNIYSDWDLNSDSALDVVSQNCLPLELDFVPYHLYHAKTMGKNGWETVWLLSGSDCCIHLYHSDDETHSYQEVGCSESFPEFANLNDITLWMDVCYSLDSKRRVSAAGGEGGSVHVFCVSVESLPQVTACHKVCWDYPVASVKIFDLHTYLPLPKFLQGVHSEWEEDHRALVPTHVVVGNSLESCYIYRDCFSTCMGHRLPESDSSDIVTCCIVCDIDQDGQNEVLVGTYGQVIRMYKHSREDEAGSWRLFHTLTVPRPVMSIAYCDVIGDGSFQLIVMTTSGIHIFQHSPWEMASLVLQRLEAFVHTHPVDAPAHSVSRPAGRPEVNYETDT